MSLSSDTSPARDVTHIAARLAHVKTLAEATITRDDEAWEIIGGNECLIPFGIDVGGGSGNPFVPLAAAEFIVESRVIAPKMANALESILEVHSSNGATDRHDQRCTQCGELYPCLTIRVVTEAFA